MKKVMVYTSFNLNKQAQKDSGTMWFQQHQLEEEWKLEFEYRDISSKSHDYSLKMGSYTTLKQDAPQ